MPAMLQPQDKELRQIKWLLVAILSCLVLIALAVVPGLRTILLACAILFGIAMLVFTISTSARQATLVKWNKVTSLWRR